MESYICLGGIPGSSGFDMQSLAQDTEAIMVQKQKYLLE